MSTVLEIQTSVSDTSRNAWRLSCDAFGIATLVFDTPGSPVNVFNVETLTQLDLVLLSLEHDDHVRALLIKSAKPHVFIAGADLKAIHRLLRQCHESSGPTQEDAREELHALLKLGQDVITRLSLLRCRKIAMIHGACVGGGLEFALACDDRILSDAEVTRVGLPETTLGLIPAWGGCTRLPQLLGFQKALELILSGKLIVSRQAQKIGLADWVVPQEHLELTARKVALGELTPVKRRKPWDRIAGIRHVMAAKARRVLIHKTKALYPAPLAALDLVTQNAGLSLGEALAKERETIAHLLDHPNAGRLIEFFLNLEQSKKPRFSHEKPSPVTRSAVIGAGVMGAGIAGLLAKHQDQVYFTDVNHDAMSSGLARIRAIQEEAVKRHLSTRKQGQSELDRIITGYLPERLPVQLVIEAASEKITLKKAIFEDLAARVGEETILATNTSALSVTELAQVVPHPERVIGLHFFNPVHRMKLVEVVMTEKTTSHVISTAFQFIQKLGKTPILVKDHPGFVVNRILMPYLMKAVKLREDGNGVREIDEAMTREGMPMGPLRLLDEVGLDIALHVAQHLSSSLPHQDEVPAWLESMVQRGWLGKKSGCGFYHYPDQHVNHGIESLLPPNSTQDILDSFEIHRSLMHRMKVEAEHVLADGVASAHDIQLAMILGSGYPLSAEPLLGDHHFSIEP